MQCFNSNVPLFVVLENEPNVAMTDGSNEAVNVSFSLSGDATGGSGSTAEVTSSPIVAVTEATTPTSIVNRPRSSANISGKYVSIKE